MRTFLEKNYFLNDFLRKTLVHKFNSQVQNVCDHFSQIDSILDYDTFEKEISKVQTNGNTLFSVKRAFGESLLYGHLNSLLDYASIDMDESIYFPIIEHGINFWEKVMAQGLPRVFQGSYLKKQWFNVYPNVPAYTIGPYINYASSYYDINKFNSIKSKLGKTLLVVPAHTHEMASQKYNMSNFVNNIMNNYGSKYDTIMVMAYWSDVSCELFDYFKKSGASIVSSGFRGDRFFIQRLKAIINLSDKVVGNDLGTFVGYSVSQNKEVELINTDISICDKGVNAESFDLKKRNQNLSDFYSNFSADCNNNKAIQENLCEKFWGISIKKSPTQIKAILDINKNILKISKGCVDKISSSTVKYLNSDTISKEEYEILSDALKI